MLRNAERVGERTYDSGGERIEVLHVKSLRTALASEAVGKLEVDGNLARSVWQIGKAEEA